ncbi:MAG: RNA-binding protein [Nitrospiraceae bacterium]|nr:RNA-binding protein [Nitrospiraceae bacterium]
MAKKIYVGNLPYSVDDEELKEMFAGMGEVLSSRIIKDPASGRSKGFGFIEMNDEEADAAIAKLNGTVYKDRTLTVSEARPREGGRPAGGRGERGGRKPGTWR